MRDYPTNRTGFDRILTVLAATFLAVSTSAAFAQADIAKKSATELAIDAAIPTPEPANVPPPTAADFKADDVQPAPPMVRESKPGDKRPRRAQPIQACRFNGSRHGHLAL